MSKDKAPREYGVVLEQAMLLKPDWTFEQCKDYCAQYGRYGEPEPIHVIEKSAYDALEAKLAECVSALEKCANPASYHAPCLSCGPKIAENGSYIAREVLSKVKK